MGTWLERMGPKVWVVVALAAALATSYAGVARGTFAAGGSDSYCYVSQASSWLDGSIARPQVVGFATPWPNADLTLAPAGYVPSPHIPGGIAPICPPGFGLVMAAAAAVAGPNAVYFLVPLFGGLLVWCTFVLGRALRGGALGVAAAIVTASSPIVLYQVVQPMSDIPAASAWLMALALLIVPTRARLLAAGAATSLAVMMRPNLAPAALVLAAAAWWHPMEAAVGADQRLTAPRPLARAVLVACGGIPLALVTAWAHATVYGSPVRAGYGSLDGLFAIAHVVPNIERYAKWLNDSHTPIVWLAALTPLVAWQQGTTWLSTLLAAFVLAVVCAYVPYTVFDDWWYLRFLLPAVPLVLILSLNVVAEGVCWASGSNAPAAGRSPRRQVVGRLAAVLVGALAVALSIQFVRTAIDRSAFNLWRSDGRFVTTGQAVARLVPDTGVVWSAFHSGNVRLYGHRPSVLWDALPADWLDRALQSLTQEGRESFLVLDSFEEPVFRQRFEQTSEFGALDWPPRVQVGNAVKIWAFGDRARFLAGERFPTERLALTPRGARGR
jgi:hypothetical protein